ncbi:hypothetical protein LX32DRAFT_633491 [Colletotrichum zoysiae]|uniref:Uncharacterized protein n=1 Tax=Colletotrichum zoysiae TaxID=1216348 RepID=A0AAD9HUL9_9PEZI|nr:hypothetical protein LX32DRAFT_633491 [Colletotrichum zoysiae]
MRQSSISHSIELTLSDSIVTPVLPSAPPPRNWLLISSLTSCMPSPIQQRLCQIMSHIGCPQPPPPPRSPATPRTGNTTIRPTLQNLFQMNYCPTGTNASLPGAPFLASVKLGENESAILGQASHDVSSTARHGLDTCLTKFQLMFWKAGSRHRVDSASRSGFLKS